MGAVYLGEHTLMGKQAAVKVLLPKYCAVPEVIDRFFNEAKSASLIKHPGIVDIYDFGKQDDGSAFIVMELLEGEALSDLLEREPRLPSLRVALLGQQIAMALAAAHVLGIVHRDLKPENIFLEPDSAATGGVRAKIIDFGIAKLSENISGSAVRTQAGAILGTPVYMPPEQCLGHVQLDHRADIYSLGCILYQMVCGRPPFVAHSLGALLAAHVDTAPPLLSHFEPSVIPNLEAIIMRTLAKNPEERPQSMSGLAVSLGTVLGDQSGVYVNPDARHPIAESEPNRLFSATPGASTSELPPNVISSRGFAKSAVFTGAAVAVAVAAFLAIFFAGNDHNSMPAVLPSTSESEPATIEVRIATEPAGVSVHNTVTGKKLGTTPFRDQIVRSRGAQQFTLKSADHVPKVVAVPLQQNFSGTFVMVSTQTNAVTKELRGDSKSSGNMAKTPSKSRRVKAKAKSVVKRAANAGVEKAAAAKNAASSAARRLKGKWDDFTD